MNLRSSAQIRHFGVALLGAIALAATVLALPASAARGLHLAFVQQPSHITAGQVISPAVSVEILDRRNLRVTNRVFPITVGLATGGGALWGTKTVNTVEGVATFSNLTVDLAGNHTLRATNPDAAPATSSSFPVTGVTTQCATSPCGLKTGQQTDANHPTNGTASVPVTACGAVQCPFLSQDFVTPAQCGDEPCLNNTGIAVYPPSNASGVVTFLLQNYFTPQSGGIGNRPVYLVHFDGTEVVLENCPNPPGDAACILRASSSKGSIVSVTVQFPADDPVIKH